MTSNETHFRTGPLPHFALAALVVFPFAACAEDVPGRAATLEYDLSIDGERVGECTATESPGEAEESGVLVVKTDCTIRLKTFFFSYVMDAHEEAALDAGGLLRYRGEVTEDGESVKVAGEREGERLTFELEAQGERHTVSFDLSQFDMTSMEASTLCLTADTPRRCLRVLDLDMLEIAEATFRFEGTERVRAAGSDWECTVVSFQVPGASGKRWIAEDDFGPVVVKEEAQDKDGAVTLLLRRVKEHP